MDRLFEFIECWIGGEYPDGYEISNEFLYMKDKEPTEEQKRLGAFACKQYHAYKLAAGVVCSKRLLNQAVGKSLRTHNLKPKKGAQVMRKGVTAQRKKTLAAKGRGNRNGNRKNRCLRIVGTWHGQGG